MTGTNPTDPEREVEVGHGEGPGGAERVNPAEDVGSSLQAISHKKSLATVRVCGLMPDTSPAEHFRRVENSCR